MKIDKHLAHIGYCSRRTAQALLYEKKVLVNGEIATHRTDVTEGDVIMVEGKKLNLKPVAPVFVAYNKPKGIVCTTEKIEGNIVDAIGHKEKIYPIGRLDKDSEGLILLTNRGEIIDKIANSENGHEKEYLVTLNFPVRSKFLKDLAAGVDLNGEITKPCKTSLEPNAKRLFRITLTQGLNRQIRRMCTKFDYQVIKLQRVRVMNIVLGKLKPGEWRDLTEEELTGLLDQIN